MEGPTDFWNDARQKFDKIKPVFMLAEAEKPDLTQAAFDMCYNWPLKNLMADIAKKGVHAQFSLDSLKAHQDSVFPQGAYLMNHITNHDLNSWEGTEFDRLGDGVKAFAVLEYTWPGMPLIYTGQEVGLNRAIKFFEKDKAPDFTNNEWTVFYKQLNVLKHSYPALRAGDGAPVVRFPATNSQVYIFSRSDKRNTILVMLNLSPKEAAVKFTSKAPKGLYHDYFKGKNAKAESVPTTLKAWEYKIFVK
jgi:glycosidase